jgi:putative transposase
LGVSRYSVSRWLKRFRHGGWRALRARRSCGRPARLTKRQWQQLGYLLDRGAKAAGFLSERWTLKRIAALIQREFGVQYHPRSLAQPLKAHGFTVQLPLPRARERDELVIARWPHEEWVELKKKRAGNIARLPSWTRQGTASSPARQAPGRAAPSARSSNASPSGA